MVATSLSGELADRLRIREVIDNFVVWFDAGDFERFRTVWTPDGIMNTTRGRMSAADFAVRAEQNWRSGAATGSHHQFSTAIDLDGDRAIAQTKVVLNSRLMVDGIDCDAQCIARFYDFFRRQEGTWRLAERQPIYERDRLDPVIPGARLELDLELLNRFPVGYRFLAYAQTRNGMTIRPDLPGLRGEALEHLYARGRAWLSAH